MYEGCSCIHSGPFLVSQCGRAAYDIAFLPRDPDGAFGKAIFCSDIRLQRHKKEGICLSHERTEVLQDMILDERAKRLKDEETRRLEFAREEGLFLEPGALRERRH